MYWTNYTSIEMEDKATATKALEILKERLESGFEIDKIYRKNPSKFMAEVLEVNDNAIVAPEEVGFYVPYEGIDVNEELLKTLATNMPDSEFYACICNTSDYDEAETYANFENGILKIKTTYYPTGFAEELFCEECSGVVVMLEDYNSNTTYICPECGEEHEAGFFDEWKPVITEKEFTI